MVAEMIRVDDTLSAVMHGAGEDVMRVCMAELKRASDLYGPYASAMEGASVMREELDELWEEVRKKDHVQSRDDMWEECSQVVAVCWRFVLDATGYLGRSSQPERLADIVDQTKWALSQLCASRPPLRSPHEGYAWIWKEYKHLWDSLCLHDGNAEKDSAGNLARYAVRAAAATMRMMIDCCWKPKPDSDASSGGSSTASSSD